MAVKRLLSSGKAESINVACNRIGLSRSAYYKYKDAVLPFYETSRGRMVTLIFAVEIFLVFSRASSRSSWTSCRIHCW